MAAALSCATSGWRCEAGKRRGSAVGIVAPAVSAAPARERRRSGARRRECEGRASGGGAGWWEKEARAGPAGRPRGVDGGDRAAGGGGRGVSARGAGGGAVGWSGGGGAGSRAPAPPGIHGPSFYSLTST